MIQSSSVTSLSIFAHCGSFCVASEDGELILARIKDALEFGQTVTLSFAGVQGLSAAFLRGAVGELLGTYSEEDLDRILRIEHMGEAERNLLNRVIANARLYYADPEKYRCFLRALENDSF